MFAICYFLLICIASILMLPFLGFLALFKAKYRTSIPARFFLYKNHKFAESKPKIWIHACSLGEVNSLQAVLKDNILKKQILLTTITNTGFKRANELFGAYKNIKIAYLPFEIFLPFIFPKSVKKLIVLEAELWFMLFFYAKKNGAKTTLLNARISTKSYPKYKKFAFFYKRLFKNIDCVLCQQDSDIARFEALGAKNIKVLGNIKALLSVQTSQNLARFQSYKNALLSRGVKILVIASTHRGEETQILRMIKENIDLQKYRIILAPRHPERFGEVWEIIKSHGFNATKYSKSGLNAESSVILLDTLGELINAYAIAECVILGGSFVKMGGHNPLECAHFGAKLISGEHIFNQNALFALVSGYTIAKNGELGQILRNIENLPQSKINDLALTKMQDEISEILAK